MIIINGFDKSNPYLWRELTYFVNTEPHSNFRLPINQINITAFHRLEEEYLSKMADEKPRVGYLCLRTPVELIEALSAVPLRLVPQSGFDIHEYGGMRPDGCSFCRMLPSFLKTPRYSGLSAIIGGACCDQMRRVFDTLIRNMNLPVILFGAPRNWRISQERG